MKLAVVSFLGGLVATPLAAPAAETNARWAVTLEGRIVASYSYARSQRDAECQATRLGSEDRELVVRTTRPTKIAVRRVRNRAAYRPAAVSSVRVTGTIGARSWTERRVCRAGPIETRSATCEPVEQEPRLVRAGFRWAGPNRIWFLPQRGSLIAVEPCGLERTVPSRGWLDLAIGKVDETALLRGRARRVVAHGTITRDGNLVEEQDLVVSEKVTARWTLTFRRIR